MPDPVPDVHQAQPSPGGQPLHDAERQRRLGAPPHLAHLVAVTEPRAQLVGVGDGEVAQGAGEGVVDRALRRPRVVAGQRFVGMIGDHSLHAGHEQQGRQAIERDLGGQCEQVGLGGEDVEQGGDEGPARLGVGTRPTATDLVRLIADRGDGVHQRSLANQRWAYGLSL